MLWIIITFGIPIVVLTISLIITKVLEHSLNISLVCFAICGVISIIGFAASCVIICPQNHPEKYNIKVVKEEYPIFALKDNMDTNGNIAGQFFLGCGEINGSASSELGYYFIKETPYGKKTSRVSARNTYIKETDEVEPKIVSTTSVIYEPKSKFYGRWLWVLTYTEECDNNIIYVPVGSIYRGFNIDLE